MVIIDGRIAYLGGMNIGKEYASEHKKLKPWNDKHIRIEGSAVLSVQTQFFLDYLFVTKEKIDFKNPKIFTKFYKINNHVGNKTIQIVNSGPDYSESNIRNMYLKMINNAKKEIIIETPYLILDDSTFDSLKLASLSGVRVRIVIPSVPDKKVVYYVTLSYAKELSKYGVEIYMYNGFMHSKIVVVDDDIVSVGSANMDRRSFNLNFEMNAVIYSKEYNEEVRGQINKELENSVALGASVMHHSVLEQLAILFSPIF